MITQNIAYVPIGPMKHKKTFVKLLSSKLKNVRTKMDVKMVDRTPLIKPDRLIFPS